jgi:putative PIN family toxin of toxin-antitoxin system
VRVVFDTNIFISSLIFPGSRAGEALACIVQWSHHLILSKPILDESLGVLARKFSRDREALAHVAVWLDDLAEWVRPTRRLTAVGDEADNRILECASAGNAEAIETGDKGLLELRTCEGIRIITLREYHSESH